MIYFRETSIDFQHVSTGCFLQNVVTIGGVVRCFGIFYVAFMEEFNSKAANAAWIAVLCGLVLNIGGKQTLFSLNRKLFNLTGRREPCIF